MNKIHIALGFTLLLTLASCGLSKTQESDTSSLTPQQETVAQQIVDEQVEDIKVSIDEMEKDMDEADDKIEAEAGKAMDSDEDTMEKVDTMVKDKDIMMQEEEEKMMDKHSHDHEGDHDHDHDTMKKEDTMEKADDATAMDKKMQAKGSYGAYSENMFGKTDNTVVFFHAAWCPSCRAADSAISVAEVPTWLTILKADYDNSADLKKKYGVVAQHTFVQVDAEGNMVKKWLGGTDIASIEKNLK